ncbi:hypothetical protein OZ411_28765 [Bradyrhizobium sp. Arg237L]|uniref:hypothetical protein n=1 Tax=Bradyrhizobium sp. Arg237L TaxID=3003352 RepID=UPI00249E017F|nr:hypothetical protein [Bradyrhizobium sp. Arg237L]MDI4236810.1 hypothetical protein [Bradyrhizobium sp. Arg237L]
MTSDLEKLSRLVRRHADGLPLPTHIWSNGATVRLTTWLQGLGTDRRDCPMPLALLMDYSAERPTVSEIALTLAARITEKT